MKSFEANLYECERVVEYAQNEDKYFELFLSFKTVVLHLFYVPFVDFQTFCTRPLINLYSYPITRHYTFFIFCLHLEIKII